MSVLILALLALPGGLVTALLASRRGPAYAVGLATAVAAVVLAASIDAADVVPLAGSIVGGSDGLRVLAVAWAASTLLFGVIDALIGAPPTVLGPSLVGLALGALGLAVPDPGIGFALVASGALVVAIVPMLAVPAGAARGVALATLRPVIASTLLVLLIVAWGASAAGPLGAVGPLGDLDPALEVAMGVALLALAAAVTLRLGAIPGHAWVARFAEAMPTSSVPPLLGWGAGAFFLVALAWIEVTISPTSAPLAGERGVIVIVGVASIVLGGIAAIIHDDIEHVLAYSIVQDAGVALLALGTLGVTAASAGRDWILASIAAKAGLAAWVHVTRASFGTNRRSDLRGWARRAPILAIAFGLVVIGAVGLPTFAGFEARATLVRLAVPNPLSFLVMLASFTPVVFLGRLMIDGFGAATTRVREASDLEPVFDPGRAGPWAGDRTPRRLVPAIVRANRLPLAAGAAVLAAVVGLSVSIGGLGSTAPTDPLASGGPAPAATQGSVAP